MQEDDLSTLRALTSQPIDTEAKVVYLLVEVRKKLESIAQPFDVLKFFCDWILHSRLEWHSARQILSAFDTLLGEELKTPQPVPRLLRNDGYISTLQPLTSLRYLLNDLFVFLGLHRLDTSLVGNLDRWGTFLGIYVDLASRTPLWPKNSKFQHLDMIRLRKSQNATRPGPVRDDIFMFTIEWSFLKEGRERMRISNEVWFPAKPLVKPVPIAKLERRDGRFVWVPQNSSAFWTKPR